MKLLARPWLHFLVLGFLLFQLERWINPPPKPVLGPLPEARVETLKKQWFGSTGRVPSAEQLQRMIAAELDRDMLFQEALNLELHLYDSVVFQRLIRNMRFLQLGEGLTDNEMYEMAMDMELHLGDEVIKRRLIQNMEQILLANAGVLEASASDLEAEFASRTEELRRPARYNLRHIFLTRDREPEAVQLLARLRDENLDPAQARQYSSPFLPGYQFNAQSPAQLARHFGAGFVVNLQRTDLAVQAWMGPVTSTYGQHLVWLESIAPERDATLDEVEKQLRRDILTRRRDDALRQQIALVREAYKVVL